MPTIQQILDDAKANPNTPQATQLRQMIESGALDKRAAAEGVQLPGRPKLMVQPAPEPNMIQKIGTGISESFKSGQERMAKGAELLNNYGEAPKEAEQQGIGDIRQKIIGGWNAGLGALEVVSSPILGIFGAGIKDITDEGTKVAMNEVFKAKLDAGIPEQEAGRQTLEEFSKSITEQGKEYMVDQRVKNEGISKEEATKQADADLAAVSEFFQKYPEFGLAGETAAWLYGGGEGKAAAEVGEVGLKTVGETGLKIGSEIGEQVGKAKQAFLDFKPITPAEQTIKDTGFIQIGNKKIPTTDSTISGGILQSMHKPIPTKAQAFAESSGVPMGEWLVERGIIDTPENTVKKLFDRFTKAKEQADLGFDAIPGRFQDPTLFKVADSLLKLEREIAQKGAASADKKFIEHLASNLQEGGLTMREVNSLKRLYERKVKTEYLKDSTKTSSDVQATTNLDTKLRQWQADKAKELGFDDLAAINKETMQSRAAMDAIGERFLRKQSNNAVSLTDWIVATGGASNPAFFGTLFGKKLISSDTFQALFAKALAKKATIGEPAINSLGSIGRKAKIQENAQAIRDAKSATQPVLPREGKIPQKPSAETLSQPTSEVKPPSFSKASPAESATPKEFQKLVSMAQTPDRSLTHLSIEELSKLKTSVLPNKKGGFALNSVDKNGKIELTNVFVSPEHRGTGIGKEVMQSAIDSAKQNGAKNIELDAYKYLEPFYNKFGFKTYRQEQFNPKFSKGFDPRIKGQESKHDVVFMRLNLK